MITIDAHQHFWNYDPVRDAWIDETMSVIRRDFLPDDLKPILGKNKVDACIAVQADQSEEETIFLLDLAAKNNFIKGVVGWLDLRAENIEARLEYYKQNKLLKGLRHIAQGEADDFLLRADVQKGISHLAAFDLTYDLLVFQHQLPAAIELVRRFPNQLFVLDHLAKPQYSEGMDANWIKHIKALAQLPNVFCKLSGMVTETKNYRWEKDLFSPYLKLLFEAFGVDRLMYGSDWPVCLLAASYMEQLDILKSFISNLSEAEQAQILGGNAVNFYQLNLENGYFNGASSE